MTELPTQGRDGQVLAEILQSEGVLSSVQRELKQLYPDLQLSLEQVRDLIRTSALRPEVLTDGRGQPASVATADGGKGNRQVRITGTYKAVPPKDEEDHDLWHDKMMSTGGG
jgi:hypothetical protein